MSKSSHVMGLGVETFAGLSDPAVNLAIWNRQLDLTLQLWLESLLATMILSEVLCTASDDIFDATPLVSTLPDHPLRQRLSDDLTHLTQTLVGSLPRGYRDSHRLHIESSFGPVRDDQCQKFHVDWVVLRLLTTWVGPGTEWLENANVNRSHVGGSACCPRDANLGIVRRPEGIRRAIAGEVLMMKGEAWPGNTGCGLVHRSPPLKDLSTANGLSPARIVFVSTIVANPSKRRTGGPKNS